LEIKTDYSGGDGVLEFCLDGYKGSKDVNRQQKVDTLF